jgi:hypothetical protein
MRVYREASYSVNQDATPRARKTMGTVMCGRKWFDCVQEELEEGAAMTVTNEVQLGHLPK